MEIKVIENTAKKLVFELSGVGHTFCNVLKEAIKEDSTVTSATYTISHPQQGKPTFYIETKSGKPKAVLENAIKDLKKKNSEFAKAFKSL